MAKTQNQSNSKPESNQIISPEFTKTVVLLASFFTEYEIQKLGERLIQDHPYITITINIIGVTSIFFSIYRLLPHFLFRNIINTVLYAYVSGVISVFLSLYIVNLPSNISVNLANGFKPMLKPTPTETEDKQQLKKSIIDLKKLIGRGCVVLKACGNKNGDYKIFTYQSLENDWYYDISKFLNREFILNDEEFRHWKDQGDNYFAGVGFNEMDKSSIFPVKDAPSSAFNKGNYRSIEIKIENLQYYLFELENKLNGSKPKPPTEMKENKVRCAE